MIWTSHGVHTHPPPPPTRYPVELLKDILGLNQCMDTISLTPDLLEFAIPSIIRIFY